MRQPLNNYDSQTWPEWWQILAEDGPAILGSFKGNAITDLMNLVRNVIPNARREDA